MPMTYAHSAIAEAAVPRASDPLFQHLLDTYASETNKVISVWLAFSPAEMTYRSHPRSSAVADIMKHQLLSERRFFAEFLGLPEPVPSAILPAGQTPEDFARRLAELAAPRLAYLAARDRGWWLERTAFFDVVRERIWIFWRRVLHTCHHRTQLAACLRLLNKPVPPIYGPTADISWSGADPTQSTEAAGRR